MSVRNEETIKWIRDRLSNTYGMLDPHDVKKDAEFLLSEIDFRDMLIADLKAESSAYEQGKSEANEVLLSLLQSCLFELECHDGDYKHNTPKQLLTEIRVVLGIVEEEKKVRFTCACCHERDFIPGDEDKRCQKCIDEGWVRGRRGWRVLGEYDG